MAQSTKHRCEVSAVSLALIAAVSLALMMARYTVTHQGFAYILPDTGDTAGRASGSGTLSSPESIPNNHHHCTMNLEPVALSLGGILSSMWIQMPERCCKCSTHYKNGAPSCAMPAVCELVVSTESYTVRKGPVARAPAIMSYFTSCSDSMFVHLNMLLESEHALAKQGL
jgi:hypothetical protein